MPSTSLSLFSFLFLNHFYILASAVLVFLVEAFTASSAAALLVVRFSTWHEEVGMCPCGQACFKKIVTDKHQVLASVMGS